MSTTRDLRASASWTLRAALLIFATGCGAANDLDEASDEGGFESKASAATGSINISCPGVSKASWIQAINGTVDLISGQTESFFPSFTDPTTTLTCRYPASVFPPILDHTVNFARGTVASACTAKVTFSGEGQQVGGVGPFGGWQFKSNRLTATATYNQATGACRLQMPLLRNPATSMSLKVSQACTPIRNGYRCPATVLPR
jgi:hypothetical protein